MDILIATKNPGKFKEISKFLKMPRVKLFSLNDFPKIKDPEESGQTFQENALIKAKYYAEKFKIDTLADDGGLEIDFWSGEPGVKSRRWLDSVHEATDEELIKYCLEKMKGVGNRKAKLTACMCLFFVGDDLRVVPHADKPGGLSLQKVYFAQESTSGIISETPSENRFPGFPFRSLLWIPEIKKFYNEDELTWEETVRYNHRYKAIQKIKDFLYNFQFSSTNFQ